MTGVVKCLTPECKRPQAANCKGLCMICVSKAKKLVESGQTTWEELEAVGLVQLPEDSFTKAFKQKKEGV